MRNLWQPKAPFGPWFADNWPEAQFGQGGRLVERSQPACARLDGPRGTNRKNHWRLKPPAADMTFFPCRSGPPPEPNRSAKQKLQKTLDTTDARRLAGGRHLAIDGTDGHAPPFRRVAFAGLDLSRGKPGQRALACVQQPLENRVNCVTTRNVRLVAIKFHFLEMLNSKLTLA